VVCNIPSAFTSPLVFNKETKQAKGGTEKRYLLNSRKASVLNRPSYSPHDHKYKEEQINRGPQFHLRASASLLFRRVAKGPSRCKNSDAAGCMLQLANRVAALLVINRDGASLCG